MTNFKILLLVFALAANISCIQKEQQQKVAANKDVVSASDKKEKVASTIDSLNYAIVNPDEAILDYLIAEDLTYGHSSGLVQNKEEFIDDLINGEFDFSSVNALNQSIQVVGETAIVRHIFSAKATKAGEPLDIRIGNILVFQKQEGEWKLLARQAFKL